MDWLSRGVEVLFDEIRRGQDRYDVIIIGSGYGGAVAASRLARAGAKVCVLERGREYLPGEFPNDMAQLPKHVRVSRSDKPDVMGETDALIDIRVGKDVSAMIGCALGGTSQLNAAVAEEARPEVFKGPQWPSAIRHQDGFLQYEYRIARRMLGVAPYHRNPAPKKLTSLRQLNRKISVAGTDVRTRFRPLQVAIRQPGVPPEQPAPAPQQPCRQCGDCCSGCNYWSKNTLTMNYLPDAWMQGARIFTGVSARTVQRAPQEWEVCVRPTARQHDGRYRVDRKLRADVVILAGGTFGSPEILLRSKRRRLITVSDRLGSGFSCNGDTLSFGFDQDEEVNAVGWGSADPQQLADPVVGPMAGGIIDLRDAERPEQRVVIEDGAIPGPLAHFAGELLTTAGMLAQLSSFRLKGDRIDRTTDPLAVSPEAMKKTQVLLVMGHDAAAGRLDFGKQGDEVEGSLQVTWDKVGEQPLYRAVADILDSTRALGGTHIPNPIWKPLPDSMSSVLSGAVPKGSLVTVHPLGGCRMADDCSQGVVNHLGQVFDARSPTSVHDGLYVLDGSIVPGSLGINPLLTITALAERNVRALAAARGWTIDDGAEGNSLPPVPVIPVPYRAPQDTSVDVTMREKLVGTLVGRRDAFGRTVGPARPVPGFWAALIGWCLGDPALFARDAAADRLDVQLELEFPIPDVLNALLREDRRFAITGTIVEVAPLPEPEADEIHWHNRPGDAPQASSVKCSMESDALSRVPISPPISLRGSIGMLQRDNDWLLVRLVRAARYWWRLRGEEEVCRELRCGPPTDQTLLERIAAYAARAWSLLKLAAHAGERRFMTYELDFTGLDDVRYTLLGRKTIAFAEGINVWRSLVDLEVTLKRRDSFRFPASGRVTMDFLDAVRHRPPQISKQPNALSGWAALASMALFLARMVIKTYLWHFRAPDYAPEPVNKLQRPGPVSGVFGPEVHPVPTTDGVSLILSHYWLEKNPALAPLVVTHGFAHSCAIFTADTLDKCLVKHLCEQGFDVWLAELRTSTALESCRSQWSFDEVAAEDLPAAIDKVLELTQCKEVNVLAHCMGAAVFSMSALLGRFDKDIKVRAAVLSQINPYVVGSRSNQLRAELRAFLQDALGLDHIDVSAHETTDWLPILADRIAATYPVEAAERHAHDAALPCPPRTDLATCNRITAVYGQNWMHRNIDPKTHAAMGRLLGYANMKTFRQINDFVQCGRVVFEQGINEYFLDHAIRDHMAFPILFLHGARSDVFHPDTSRQGYCRFVGVHSKNTYGCIIKKNYGHLDLWLGRRAHQDGESGVYHHVSDFLKLDFAPNKTSFGRKVQLKPAVRGPLLGWIGSREEVPAPLPATTIFARLWWELDATDTHPPQFGMVVKLPAKNDLRGTPELVGIWPFRYPRIGGGGAGRPVVPLTAYAVADVPVALLQSDGDLWFAGLHLKEYGRDQLEDGRHENGKKYILTATPDDLAALKVDWQGRTDVPLTAEIAMDAVRDVPQEAAARARLKPARRAIERIVSDRHGVSFLLASCRYPGTMFEADLADRAFRRMEDELRADGDDAPSFSLMVGDQIYADATAGIFDTQTMRERVLGRYRKAWSSPAFASLVRSAATVFAIDDHEIWNDYEPTHDDGGRRGGKGRDALEWARLAYSTFQASSGPGSTRVPQFNDDDDFHHQFEAGGFPFFVMDTRLTRQKRTIDTVTKKYDIVGPTQKQDLLTWLSAQDAKDKSRPKFIVCGSVLAPLWAEGEVLPAYRARDDGWNGYEATLHTLIDHIAQRGIRNVVFLTGDYHCSTIADMRIVRNDAPGAPVHALDITASPLYAPIPFANGVRSDYCAKGGTTTGTSTMNYTASHFVDGASPAGGQQGTYSRIRVSSGRGGWGVRIEVASAASGETISAASFVLPYGHES